MNKFISAVILTTFTVVCSFGAVAGGNAPDENKEAMRKDSSQNKSKKEGGKYKSGSASEKEGGKYKSGSASGKDGDTMREKSLSERQNEYRDQEVMNKKPYKQ